VPTKRRERSTTVYRAEFLVCKCNIGILHKSGPLFRLNFLKGFGAAAKKKGDTGRASKLNGMIHKEDIQKWWRNINKSTCKARGSLRVALKVPSMGGGYNKFTTEQGVFNAVRPIILERFQSTLVAQCHQGFIF
jgi:hypothetical protein